MTEVIDRAALDVLLETVGGDLEFLGELIGDFFDDSPQQLAAAGEALEADDAEALRRAAHSLKSNSANFGAMALSRAIRKQAGKDEMIGILLPNSAVATLTNIAITVLGRCAVNLNYTASAEAVDKAIEKCEIGTIFTSREFIEKLGMDPRPEMVFMEDFKQRVGGLDRFRSALGFWLLPHWRSHSGPSSTAVKVCGCWVSHRCTA